MSQNTEIIQVNNSLPRECSKNDVAADDNDENEAIKMQIIQGNTKENINNNDDDDDDNVIPINNNNIINYNNNISLNTCCNNNNNIEISDDEEEYLVKIDDNCEFTSTSNGSNNPNHNNNNNTNAFYNNAQKYWNSIEPTINGMLGGFASKCHVQDVRGSNTFLREIFKLKPQPPQRGYALDCGAGIGRVTKHLLSDYFEHIDMVEQNATFLNAAREYLGEHCNRTVNHLYNQGLQDFTPEPQKYDIIWCQWVLGHLKDPDLVEFFKRCSMGLSKNGMLVVKENVTRNESIDIDKIDSSVTRPLPLLKRLLIEANMRIVKIQQQQNFPKGLFPVYMIAVKPLGGI